MSGIIGGAGSKSGVIGTTELDYEEGFMTNPAGTTSATVTSYNSKSTKYVKIGSHVFVNYYFSWTAGPTGDIRILLPFTAAASVTHAADWNKLYLGGWSSDRGSFVSIPANTDYGTIYQGAWAGISVGTGEETRYYGTVNFYT